MTWLRQQKWIAIFFLFYIFLALINFQVDIGEYGYTDDFFYERSTRQAPLPQWIGNRYENWSGRLSADTLTYLLFHAPAGITVWRLVNPVFLLLLVYSIARLAIGPSGRRACDRRTLIFFFMLAFSAVGLMAGVIFIEASYWITGSVNYLWPTALGLFSLIPLWDHVIFGQPTRLTALHIIAGIIAVNAGEQIALVITCLALILLALWFHKTRQLNGSFILYLVALVASALVLLLAPGSVIRYASSVKMYFPGFDHFSLGMKALLGVQYVFNSILSFNKVLLIALWLVLLVYLWRHFKQEKASLALTAGLALAVTLLLITLDPSRSEKVSAWLLNFDGLVHYNQAEARAWVSFNLGLIRSMVSILFWGLILFVVTPLSIYRVFKNSVSEIILYLSLYFGGIASLFIMGFSPTIYASGYRPRYLFMMLLAILLLTLVKRTFPNLQNPNRAVYAASMLVPLVLFIPYLLIFQDFSLAQPATPADFSDNGQAKCYLDVVENNSFTIHASGWIYLPGHDSWAGEKYVLLRSAENLRAFTAASYTRSDVNSDANDGGNYERAGFTTNVNKNDLPPGRYQVGLGIRDKNTSERSACFFNQYIDTGAK